MPYEVPCPACGSKTQYEHAHAEIVVCRTCGRPILVAEAGEEIAVKPARRQLPIVATDSQDQDTDGLHTPFVPFFDACDVCGRRHAAHRCPPCGLQLCETHEECPECGETERDLSHERKYPAPSGRHAP